MDNQYAHLKGKRLGAVDYGRKRTGFAVCDEFHITTSPRKALDTTSPSFMQQLMALIEAERVRAVIVGVPYRLDNVETEVIAEINSFIEELKNISGLEIIPYDESFTTKRAVNTLIEIGKKKRKRSEKGMHDMIAAALILRDFLKEIE